MFKSLYCETLAYLLSTLESFLVLLGEVVIDLMFGVLLLSICVEFFCIEVSLFLLKFINFDI